MKQPKILLYDLEITPTKGWTYGLYDTNVIRVEEQPYIMCFSYRWLGQKKIHNVSLPEFGDYETDPTMDYALCEVLWDLFDKADIVVAHNAVKFDNRVANGRFLYWGFEPPSPYKTVDTLQSARRIAKFNSNSLDNLGEHLDLGRKSVEKHGDLWYRCLQGEELAWKKMVKYNNQDVEVLTNLYLKLRPYMPNHPNLATIAQRPESCPRCNGTHIQSRGTATTTTGTYARFHCEDCGFWPRARVADKDDGHLKPTYVN